VTYAPATLRALATYWSKHGGANLGIVGDTSHVLKGTSYHLGRSRLELGAYSRITPRDKAGLTEAAAAIDLGKLSASYAELRVFSRWLVARCQANAAGTSDIREVIYTADGETVLRYDRERGVASAPRAGEADGSHLWHTHVSFYRDSEGRSKAGIFAPFFALPDTSTEEEVVIVTVEKWPQPRTFSAAGDLRRFTPTEELPAIDGPYSATVDANVDINSTGVPHGSGFLRLSSGGSAGKYILASEVTLT
jgi:hypothetical protein